MYFIKVEKSASGMHRAANRVEQFKVDKISRKNSFESNIDRFLL